MNPVLAPVLPVRDELEVPPGQRMEPVRHPDTPVPIIWISCSRRCGPTRPPNDGSAACAANAWTLAAARTWHELTRLTADLPDPADAAGPAATGMPDGLDRCLLCALLIVCPPAGITWLLASRHHSRDGQRPALTAAGPL